MLLEQEIKSENKAPQLIQNKNEDCLLIFNPSVIEINFQYCSHLILRSFFGCSSEFQRNIQSEHQDLRSTSTLLMTIWDQTAFQSIDSSLMLRWGACFLFTFEISVIICKWKRQINELFIDSFSSQGSQLLLYQRVFFRYRWTEKLQRKVQNH